MSTPAWLKWARAAVRDPSSPSLLTREVLASLTGQDMRALTAIAACWDLYAAGDSAAEQAALDAARVLVLAMQPKTRWVARELIPYALDWHDRDRLEIACGRSSTIFSQKG